MSEWSATLRWLAEMGSSVSSVAPKGVAVVSGNRLLAQADPEVSPGDTKRPADFKSVPESVSGKGGFPDVPKVKEEAAPEIDRFGDDRFADNILRALYGLPQHGDDEEERDAAEEGALIEASGMPDPKFESNGRY